MLGQEESTSWISYSIELKPGVQDPQGMKGGGRIEIKTPRQMEDLYYYRARYYDPRAGRFLTKDPIGFAGGDVNVYRYVTNDPINQIDPLGLWGPKGHRDLSKDAITAFSSYFTPADIEKIIMANIGVDITNPAQNAAHYMPGTCKEAAWIINKSLEMAIQLEIAGLHEAALYFLAMGLHTLQDKFAHFEQNAGWAEHFRKGPSPDDPLAHPIEYLRARKASMDYIGRFIEEVTRRRVVSYR